MTEKAREGQQERQKEKEKEKEKDNEAALTTEQKLLRTAFQCIGKEASSSSGHHAELELYKQEPSISTEASALEWWRAKRHQYPTLAALATGNIITKKRSKLTPEHACDLIFAYQNRAFY